MGSCCRKAFGPHPTFVLGVAVFLPRLVWAASWGALRHAIALYPGAALAIRAAVRSGGFELAVEEIDDNYRPTEDEIFMNERQKEYFRRKLITWKEEILRDSYETLALLQNENENHPDLADRASFETDRSVELRARDRQRKLIAKIDAALARLDEGTYGYCEETGEPISLKRLDARPIATLSVEAQERHERREKTYRET